MSLQTWWKNLFQVVLCSHDNNNIAITKWNWHWEKHDKEWQNNFLTYITIIHCVLARWDNKCSYNSYLFNFTYTKKTHSNRSINLIHISANVISCCLSTCNVKMNSLSGSITTFLMDTFVRSVSLQFNRRNYHEEYRNGYVSTFICVVHVRTQCVRIS